MSGKLQLAPQLALPLDAVTQTFGVLAKRGAGKTYTGAVLCEEFLKAKQQIIVVDPIGVWWGLRSSADGKSDGYPIYVIGGDHADVPLEETGGKLAADFAIDTGQSVILDLSLLRKGAQIRFMTDFAEQLYHRNRSAVHVVIDEADAFAPQKPQKGIFAERLLGAIEDLVRRGRARGIGLTLITQRSAVLNKNVLTQIEVLIALRTTAPQDVAAIRAWVDFHDVEEKAPEMLESLPSLPIGDAWVWSPGWLDLFKRVHIRERETFDSSRTPKPGEKRREPKAIAAVDLAKLSKEMLATAERAKENDPKQLRAKILELQKTVAARVTPVAPAKASADEVLKIADRARAQAVREFAKRFKRVDSAVQKLHAQYNRFLGDTSITFKDTIAALEELQSELPSVDASAVAPRPAAPLPVRAREPRPAPPPPVHYDGDIKISAPRQRMLDRMLSFENSGVGELSRGQLAALSDQSPKSSSYDNNLSALRAGGLIENRPDKRLALTDAGRALARAPERAVSLEGYHESWSRLVSGPQWRMLDLLIAAYPEAIDYLELAAATTQSPTSSSWENNVSALRSLGLIKKEKGASPVSATELLFPAGLS